MHINFKGGEISKLRTQGELESFEETMVHLCIYLFNNRNKQAEQNLQIKNLQILLRVVYSVSDF